MPSPEDGWLTSAGFHAEAIEIANVMRRHVSFSYFSAMERIYLQRQMMGGSRCTLHPNGTMPGVSQSFLNMERILMLQVKEASHLGFEESEAIFR
jgi:hypothetical protein